VEKGHSKADSAEAGRQHRPQAWFPREARRDSVQFSDGFAAIRCRHSGPVASTALPVRHVPLAPASARQAADAGLAGCGTARQWARSRPWTVPRHLRTDRSRARAVDGSVADPGSSGPAF